MISLACVIILGCMSIWLARQNAQLRDEVAEQLYINRTLSVELIVRDLLADDEGENEWKTTC